MSTPPKDASIKKAAVKRSPPTSTTPPSSKKPRMQAPPAAAAAVSPAKPSNAAKLAEQSIQERSVRFEASRVNAKPVLLPVSKVAEPAGKPFAKTTSSPPETIKAKKVLPVTPPKTAIDTSSPPETIKVKKVLLPVTPPKTSPDASSPPKTIKAKNVLPVTPPKTSLDASSPTETIKAKKAKAPATPPKTEPVPYQFGTTLWPKSKIRPIDESLAPDFESILVQKLSLDARFYFDALDATLVASDLNDIRDYALFKMTDKQASNIDKEEGNPFRTPNDMVLLPPPLHSMHDYLSLNHAKLNAIIASRFVHDDGCMDSDVY